MKPVFTQHKRSEQSKNRLFILLISAVVAAIFLILNSERSPVSFSGFDVVNDNRLPSYTPVRPDQCSDVQKNEILRQFGGDRIKLQCASNCPIATWWEAFYLNDEDRPHPSKPKISVSIGCNKGIEAVDSLARLSRDPSVDRQKWEQVNWGMKAACRPPQKHEAKPLPIRTGADGAVMVPTQVYCVEAMPTTVEILKKRVVDVGLSGKMHILHYAMGDSNGVVKFPNVTSGLEYKGVHDCNKRDSQCTDVDLMTLDSLEEKHIKGQQQTGEDDFFIDILTIDTEGHDWPVLLGGRRVLNHIRYLEFEHNTGGAWKLHDLKDVVNDLDKNYGFVCYYSGKGKLWRLTDCWVDFYSVKAWTNVACVNSRDPTMVPLAKRMEDIFLETITIKE